MEEYLGPHISSIVLPIYHRCIAVELPVYTVDTVKDADGHQVDYERLLLPFGAGGKLSHIIASLKTISPEGRFQLRDLLRRTGVVPTPVVRAIIDRELVHKLPTRGTADDLTFE